MYFILCMLATNRHVWHAEQKPDNKNLQVHLLPCPYGESDESQTTKGK